MKLVTNNNFTSHMYATQRKCRCPLSHIKQNLLTNEKLKTTDLNLCGGHATPRIIYEVNINFNSLMLNNSTLGFQILY